MGLGPFELRILGPTELTGTPSGVADANPQPPKRLALLAYLALETAGGFRRRDQIVGLFWPDLPQEAARTQLRKALFVLRERLGGDAVISRGESEVRLDPSRVWCDAVALSQCLSDGRWSDGLALYRGELLEGLFPEGVAQEFEEWLAEKRKALREQAAVAAWECSRIEEERGDRKAAAVVARRALDLTPDDEDGVRRLMSLLDRHGDRGGALRIYSEWQARLQAEYGVEPAPETRKLARKVQAARKGESHETPPTHQFAPLVAPLPPAAADPRRRTRPRWWIGAGAAILLAVMLGVALLRVRAARTAVLPTSIAVLPLGVIGDPSLANATQAIAEELTTALVLISGLIVRPVARGREVIDSSGDPGQIGQRLRVAYVLDGGMQGEAGRLRLTLRLIRVSDATAVWAGVFNPDGGDESAAMRRTATDAAAAIGAKILGSVSPVEHR